MYAYKGRYYPTDALTPDTMKIIDVTADKHNGVGVWLIGGDVVEIWKLIDGDQMTFFG